MGVVQGGTQPWPASHSGTGLTMLALSDSYNVNNNNNNKTVTDPTEQCIDGASAGGFITLASFAFRYLLPLLALSDGSYRTVQRWGQGKGGSHLTCLAFRQCKYKIEEKRRKLPKHSTWHAQQLLPVRPDTPIVDCCGQCKEGKSWGFCETLPCLAFRQPALCTQWGCRVYTTLA